jgi:hypothetical protein
VLTFHVGASRCDVQVHGLFLRSNRLFKSRLQELDFVETFAGCAVITKTFLQAGLKGVPLDIMNHRAQDINSAAGFSPGTWSN